MLSTRLVDRPTLVFALTFVAVQAQAALHLPAILSDHMVLQQDKPVRIWGTSLPGQPVTVRFRDQVVSAPADEHGRWKVWLKPLRPSAPTDLTITAGDESRKISDVLVGEVWVGSGQSNMHFPMWRVANAAAEIAAAGFSGIRFFEVEFTIAGTPREDVPGKWIVCSPQTVRNASAVGYYFSRDLHRRLQSPVGFIHASGGGTAIQSWISRESLEADPSFAFVYREWQKILDAFPAANAKYLQRLADWTPESGQPKPSPPHGPGTHLTPSCLFNGMLYPLTPYAIRGVTWYQGETNGGGVYAFPYRSLFRTMIGEWRRLWGQGDFPFLFVQLANLNARNQWPVLRESQALALQLPNTAMAVTIDIGDSRDIHPTNKHDVGFRLALAARALAYGERVEYSGPLYRKMAVEGTAIRLWFDHAGSGLVLRGEKGFMIRPRDGSFEPALARIEGDSLIVWSPRVQSPEAVRYAWANDPYASLYNADGLPASPFRTDVHSSDRMAGGEDKP